MRVVFVSTSYPEGDDDPAGHFVRAEVRACEREGHEVVVVKPPAGGAFGWPGVRARVGERWSRAVDAGAWVVRARGEVARARPARVVAHWAIPSAWPIAFAAGGAELEVVSHGGDVRLLLAMPAVVRERLVMRIAARATVWRFVSEGLLRQLLGGLAGSGGLTKLTWLRGLTSLRAREEVERIAQVRPAAIELPDVKERILTRRGALHGRPFAVVVARLVPAKRVDRVIEHVAERRRDLALVVVGDGPERSRLEALARDRGVDAQFTGLVRRPEALAWIGAADVLLHASEQEGCSTVLREADALGVAWHIVGPGGPTGPSGRGPGG